VSGDANSCTVTETDTATDTFSDSEKDTGGGSEALGNDPLAASLDGGSGGTQLTGSDLFNGSVGGNENVTVRTTTVLAGGYWTTSAFHADVSGSETSTGTDSGSGSDTGTGGGSGNSVSGEYTNTDTENGSSSESIDGVGDSRTVSIHSSASDNYTDSESGSDKINSGSGTSAVHDADTFNEGDSGSGTDTMDESFGMVNGSLTLQSYSERQTDQYSESASDSGTDTTGSNTDTYNDTASKTGSDTSVITGVMGSGGMNYTETDTQTDPYIFKNYDTPSTGPADVQTGYVALDMTRVLTWTGSAAPTVASATFGADGSYQDAAKGNGSFQITGDFSSGAYHDTVTPGGIGALSAIVVNADTFANGVNGFFGTLNAAIKTGIQNSTTTGPGTTVTNTVTATSGGGTQVVQVTAAETETIIYNAGGKVLSDVMVDNASGQTLFSRAYTYDAYGDTLTDTEGGQTTAWTYDDSGHQLTETQGYGSAHPTTTRYGYDFAGDLTSVTDPDNNTTTFAYDGEGHVTLMTDPLGHQVKETYNDQGQLTSVINRNGLARDITYTADGQIATETWYAADGTTVVDTLTYTYFDSSNDGGNAAEDGKLKAAANSAGTYAFSYDTQGRITHVTEPFAVSLTFGYDNYGNRTLVSDSLGGTTTSQYDNTNELTNLTFSRNGQTVLSVGETYTANAQLQTQTDYGSGNPGSLVASSTYTYDAAGRLTDLAETGPTGNTIADYLEAYNSGNQLTSKSTSGNPENYTYDNQGELKTAANNTYSYDANGNRTMAGYVIGPDNQILSDGLNNYTYDAEGNEATKTKIATGDKWTYSYDNMNHMVQAVDKTSAGAVELTAIYKYDVFGNRIEKDVSYAGQATQTTKFALDGWNPALAGNIGNTAFNVWADLNADGSLATRYIRGDAVDQLIARVSPSGAPAWYLVDNQGSIRTVLDSAGTVRGKMDYDAYGKITSEKTYDSSGTLQSSVDPTILGRYAWTGRELDVETGLQYNRARYYDSGTGRWISQDPMGFDAGDSNLYRYVNNKPTQATDPSGLDGRFFFQLTMGIAGGFGDPSWPKATVGFGSWALSKSAAQSSVLIIAHPNATNGSCNTVFMPILGMPERQDAGAITLGMEGFAPGKYTINLTLEIESGSTSKTQFPSASFIDLSNRKTVWNVSQEACFAGTKKVSVVVTVGENSNALVLAFDPIIALSNANGTSKAKSQVTGTIVVDSYIGPAGNLIKLPYVSPAQLFNQIPGN